MTDATSAIEAAHATPIIRTRLAFSGWRMLMLAVVCLLLGAWGAYDLWVTIPRREQAFLAYERAQARLDALEEIRNGQRERGLTPSPAEVIEFDTAQHELTAAMPAGKIPHRPGKWDRLAQWGFIVCAPFAPLYGWWFLGLLRQRYWLDEFETLHFQGDRAHGSGAWAKGDIAAIDMSRWMEKSIAWVQHIDGRRLKLDAHYHRDLHLLIGAIAARLHPDQWTREAKTVKLAGAAEPSPEPEMQALDEPARQA